MGGGEQDRGVQDRALAVRLNGSGNPPFLMEGALLGLYLVRPIGPSRLRGFPLPVVMAGG